MFGGSVSEEMGKYSFPHDSTINGAMFIVPDFTVSTGSASVVHFTTNGSIAEVCISYTTLGCM